MRDLYHNIGAVQALAPAVQSASVNGLSVERTGFESVTFVINTGAIVGDGDFTASVEHADEDGGSPDSFSAVSSDLLGTLPASLEANATIRVGYVGEKQFVRLVLTKNGGTSIAAGAVAILGHPHQAPTE